MNADYNRIEPLHRDYLLWVDLGVKAVIIGGSVFLAGYQLGRRKR